MDKKHEKIVQVALIVTGLITYGVATYLIVKIVVALNALNTVPAQPKKLPEARAIGTGHVEKSRAAAVFPHPRLIREFSWGEAPIERPTLAGASLS
jgi:hypothetical protein